MTTDNATAAGIAALLELHAQDRPAHLTGDAERLTATMADEVWEASRGGLQRKSRSEMRDRFAAYFASVAYSAWDDVHPPRVVVSPDRSSAWMAVPVTATMTARDDAGDEKNVALGSSWISVYEKRDGRWLMVGIASSVVEQG